MTVHGKPVSVLHPYSEDDVVQDRQFMIEHDLAMLDHELAEEIGKSWSSGESALEALERFREQSACR